MKAKKEIILLAFSLSISVIFAEIGLRVFTSHPIHGDKANRISHPVLGYTLDPSKLSDVDASGFRNPRDKGQHEIVVIGDSHTQGFNVESQFAWPYQLGRLSNKSVYNYGVGGYGIFHYPYLAKEAKKHKPEYVLLGFFPKNDISPDACRAVSPVYYQELLDKGLTHVACRVKPRTARKKFHLSEYSAFASALKHSWKTYIRPQTDKIFNSQEYFEIGGNLVKKIGVFKQNEADLSRKGVNDNFEASKLILSFISKDLHGSGIKFGVVIIPSKNLVIERWAIEHAVAIPEKFSVEPEKDLIEKYIAFLDEKNIPAIDSTPYIVEAFAESMELKEEFYPFRNGHPLVKGYESYSTAALALITEFNLDETKAAGGDAQ
jgi:hypothetical protein